MSKRENEIADVRLYSIERPGEADQVDPLGSTTELISPEIPPGVNRRDFLIRSAVVGAASVMTGRPVQARERMEKAIATMPQQAQKTGPPLSADLDVVKKSEGAGDDGFGRVLQSGAGPVELAHDRPDAHYL